MAITPNTPEYGNVFFVGDSYADLASVPSRKIRDGYSALVKGRFDATDRSGGLFFWNADDTSPDGEFVVAPADGSTGRWLKTRGVPGETGPKGDGLEQVMTPNGSGIVGFKQAGTGSINRTVQSRLRDEVNVRDFGAVGDGVADDWAAIQAAIDYCRSLPRRRANGITDTGSPYFVKASTLIIPAGVYRVTKGLWFGVNSNASGWDASTIVENVIAHGAVIVGETGGKPVVDLSGAFGMKIEGLSVYGGPTATPDVGILLARTGLAVPGPSNPGGDNPSAGLHRFINVNVHGDFTVACVANYASEINAFEACFFYQNSGKYVYYGTNDNVRHNMQSDYAPIATSVQSAYGDFFGNCYFKNSTANATANGAVMLIESMDFGPKISGGYIDTSGTVYMPSIILANAVGLTNANTTSYNQGVSIENVQFEYRSNQDMIVVSDDHLVIDLTISGCSLPANTRGGFAHLKVSSAGGKVKNLRAQHTDGGTFGDPFIVSGGGEVYGWEAGVYPMRAAAIGTSWQIVEGDMVRDGTFKTLDLAPFGVPATAKFVAVKVLAKTTAAADANSMLLRGFGSTATAQFMEVTPPVSGIAVQHEGLVPVVGGKIQYSVPANFNAARILLREYHL